MAEATATMRGFTRDYADQQIGIFLAFAIGYTNSSWTLKVGLLCEHFCRLLAHMRTVGLRQATPRNTDADVSADGAAMKVVVFSL